MTWVRARVCKLQKGCTRVAAASDKVYQLLAHGQWFSPGTPASSTTKTGRHDIAEILLKVALNTMNQIKTSKYIDNCWLLGSGGRHGRDRMVVRFTTTCLISAYHHKSCEFESRTCRGVPNTALRDKGCQ